MPESVCGDICDVNPSMSISKSVRKTKSCNSCLHSEVNEDLDCCPVLPGLPDDIAKYCLALVPRSYFPKMGGVSRRWRSFIKSKEFIVVRKLAGLVEEWLYVLTTDAEGDGTHWEVLDCLGNKLSVLPQMPGPMKAGFGVVVLNGKLIVMAGYSMSDGVGSVSSDVYQYDSCLNRFVPSFTLFTILTPFFYL
ncbi:putative F-box domain, kelch-type beta propeller [Helianthus annuus]|nr:putative F-box domain, kelch-type beta propeller [Helianthus annuus]KAJ0720938.1 putative F-box domain, kelch-type beta propeller [Helianthus annuus]